MKECILTILVCLCMSVTIDIGRKYLNDWSDWPIGLACLGGIVVGGLLLSMRDNEIIRKFCRKLLQEHKGN